MIDKWCPMCGAAPGEPCTVISGDPEADEKPGDERTYPHAARHNDGPIPVLVKDEPAFATNPPRLPIEALREGSMADFEVVELAAASARADAFTYGEPFHLLAARLDEVAEKLRGGS